MFRSSIQLRRFRARPLIEALLAGAFAAACAGGDGAPVTGPDLPISAATGGTRTITIAPSAALNSTAASPFGVGTITSPFGSGNLATQTLTVTNSGTKTTSGLTVSALAAPFAVTADQCTGRSLGIAGSRNSSCTLRVTFTPTATGTFTATLTITIAQPKTSLTVYLRGVAQDPTYTVAGRLFFDTNHDGVHDDAESGGAASVTVNLKNQAGTTTLQTTTSGNDGSYSFADVGSGSYQVTVDAAMPKLVTTTNPRAVTVGSAAVSDIDFGVGQYTVYGRVVYGIPFGVGGFSCPFVGGTPAPGVELTLVYNSFGSLLPIGTPTTRADGYWGRFDVLDPSLLYGVITPGPFDHSLTMSFGVAPLNLGISCTGAAPAP